MGPGADDTGDGSRVYSRYCTEYLFFGLCAVRLFRGSPFDMIVEERERLARLLASSTLQMQRTHARNRVVALVAAHGVHKMLAGAVDDHAFRSSAPASQGQPSLPLENQPLPAVPKQLAPSHPPLPTPSTSNPGRVKCPASFSLFFLLSPSNFILDHISSALPGPVIRCNCPLALLY